MEKEFLLFGVHPVSVGHSQHAGKLVGFQPRICTSCGGAATVLRTGRAVKYLIFLCVCIVTYDGDIMVINIYHCCAATFQMIDQLRFGDCLAMSCIFEAIACSVFLFDQFGNVF